MTEDLKLAETWYKMSEQCSYGAPSAAYASKATYIQNKEIIRLLTILVERK
jgi:hypothetical protein